MITRGSAVRAAGWIVATVLGVAGCAAIAGIEDIEISQPGGAGGGGGLDGGLTGPGCGADLVCAPQPPLGWKFVALADTPTAPSALDASSPLPPCPDGYSQAADLRENVTGAASACPCACDPDAGLSFACNYQDDNPGEGPSCAPSGFPLVVDDQCWNGGALGSGDFVSLLSMPVPEGGVSGCNILPPAIPTPSFSFVRVCATQVDPLPSTSCPQADVCARQSTDPYVVCVESPDEGEAGASGDTCPSGYPTRHVLAIDVDDGRACAGSCVCQAPVTCLSPTLDVFSDRECQNLILTIPNDSACHAAKPYLSWTFEVGPVASSPCTVTTNTLAPEGGIAPTGTRTVCCP